MLEFSLTVDDLAAFAAWQAEASGEEEQRRGRLRLTGAWLVGAAVYLVAFLVSTLPLLLTSQLLPAGLAEVASVLVGAAAGWWEWSRGKVGERLLARRYRSRARMALEATGSARRLWLDDAGLNVASGDRSAHVPWSAITGVVDAPGHVFVCTGAKAAHVVPRRTDAPGVARLAEDIRVRLVSG